MFLGGLWDYELSGIVANQQVETPFSLQQGIWVFGPTGSSAYNPRDYHDCIYFMVKRSSHNGAIGIEIMSYSWYTFNPTYTNDRTLQFTTSLSGKVGFRRVL